MWCYVVSILKILLIGLSLILSSLYYYSWKFLWELNFTDFVTYKNLDTKIFKFIMVDTFIHEILNPRNFPAIMVELVYNVIHIPSV